MDFNNAMIKAALDLLPFAIYWADENKRIIGCNTTHETVCNVTYDNSKGKNVYEFSEIIGWETSIPTLVDSNIAKTIESKKSDSFFISFPLADNKKHPYTVFTIPITTDDTVKMIGIGMDLELIAGGANDINNIFLSTTSVSGAIQTLAQLTLKHPGTPNSIKISNRELACIKLLKEGLSSKKIAAVLNISKRTVEQYIDTAKNKLGCKNSVELVYKCFKNGILC